MNAALLKRFFCRIAALFFLASPGITWSVVEDFNDALTSDWLLFGSATHSSPNGWIQLTSDTGYLVGAVFYNQPFNTASFEAEFDVYCGSYEGADGLVFAFVSLDYS